MSISDRPESQHYQPPEGASPPTQPPQWPQQPPPQWQGQPPQWPGQQPQWVQQPQWQPGMQPGYVYSQQEVDAILLKSQQKVEEVETALLKKRGREMAEAAWVAAAAGMYICFFVGFILEPYAIYKARQAKKILAPGEEGRREADKAETLGWIMVVLWILGLGYLTLTGNLF